VTALHWVALTSAALIVGAIAVGAIRQARRDAKPRADADCAQDTDEGVTR